MAAAKIKDACGVEVEGTEMRLRSVQVIRSRGSDASTASLKYISLLVLVFQNAGQVLLIRYARTRPKKEMFLSTSAVFFTEIVKLVACLFIVAFQEGGIVRCFSLAYSQIICQPMDTLKVCVPSIIYTIQNNLLYVAVSNLAAATFMVTYQLKILTTALFSVAMLRKPLSKAQWLALSLLFIGVSIVQLQEQQQPAPGGSGNRTSSPTPGARTQSPLVGLCSVVFACLLSGFAGIYFEKILKGSEVSVWMRNVQLAVLSVPISYVTMVAKDEARLRTQGLLYGYDGLVWTIVFMYALGGLTVAVVIKYADNILKGFATSVAIVVSCLVSMYLFHFVPSPNFLVGAALVICSIYVYSKFPVAPPNNPPAPAKTLLPA